MHKRGQCDEAPPTNSTARTRRLDGTMVAVGHARCRPAWSTAGSRPRCSGAR